ncbi:MAG: hypothetical protein IT305_04835 [Chloroflexi bacterium]|nr:hypothetical protein [Chloroflexota bacterium]
MTASLTSGHAIPVFAASGDPAHPVGELTAEVFAVTAVGQVVRELQQVPVQDGVAVYTGPTPPAGQFFAIRIRQVGAPGSVFRSGPLRKLPGPPSPLALTAAISLVVGGGTFDLTSPGSEGASEVLVEHLRSLPAPLQFVGVNLTGNRAGNYVVTLRGRVQFGWPWLRFNLPFTYRRAWHLAGNLDPGRPKLPVLAEPFGAATIRGQYVRPYAAVLDRLIQEAVERQLDAAVELVASLVLLFAHASFGVQTVSVSTLEVVPRLDGGADARVSLGAGAITGQVLPPTPVALGEG